MNNRNPLSLNSKLTLLGLLVAAVGISTLFLTTSVVVPAIPNYRPRAALMSR